MNIKFSERKIFPLIIIIFSLIFLSSTFLFADGVATVIARSDATRQSPKVSEKREITTPFSMARDDTTLSRNNLFTEESKSQSFSYDDYAFILTKFVNIDGMVNYKGLKSERTKLDNFTKSLAEVDEKAFSGWPDNEKISFWINAYNSLTLKAIIDNYPIKTSFFSSFLYPANSIRQISGVWDEIRFPVMGQMMTLEDIEHRRLRVNFNEPRIHFAIVCASMGCSPLRNGPYYPGKLNTQLDGQVKKFLSNKNKFKMDNSKEIIYLSPIFKWFAEDFTKSFGGNIIFSKYGESESALINFISRYLGKEQSLLLKNKTYEIEYLDYDWSLNEQK